MHFVKKKDHVVFIPQATKLFSSQIEGPIEKKAWKNSGLYRIRTLDLSDTSEIIYQLSYTRNKPPGNSSLSYKPIKGWWWNIEYMYRYMKISIKNNFLRLYNHTLNSIPSHLQLLSSQHFSGTCTLCKMRQCGQLFWALYTHEWLYNNNFRFYLGIVIQNLQARW